jgi:MFS family permease
VSVAEGIAAWTVAGLGMGMTYSPMTLLMMQAAPAGGEGWASASLNLADVLGSAMGIGIGGAAAARRGPRTEIRRQRRLRPWFLIYCVPGDLLPPDLARSSRIWPWRIVRGRMQAWRQPGGQNRRSSQVTSFTLISSGHTRLRPASHDHLPETDEYAFSYGFSRMNMRIHLFRRGVRLT